MAVTANKQITIKQGEEGKFIAFPVLAGEKILSGVFSVVGADGYLKTATAANIKTAKAVVITIDALDNTSGVNGNVATGLNLVRAYVSGTFKLANFTSITQAMVMKSMFITDNYTIDEAQVSGIKAGTLVQYLSATSGYLELNKFYNADGLIVQKVPLVAAADGTAGAVLAWANPTGQSIIVEKVIAEITHAATDALGAVDIGVAANGTTASDTIIDGLVIDTVGTFSPVGSGGTNGKGDRLMTSGQYITGTSKTADHLNLAGMTGNAHIFYRLID